MIIIFVLGFILLCYIGFTIKLNSEIRKMNHLETQEVLKNIYVIKTKNANFYVLNYGGGYIAIDAGGGNKNIAKDELRKMQINPDKITAVLLTHTDSDHISALSLFKNATIYISNQEVQMIDGSVSRMFGIAKNKLNYEYKILQNNEELTIGNIYVKTILTPGHTNGSMSYIINNTYVFVGDTVSLKNGIVGLFNSFFNMNDDAQKRSIKNLSKLKNIEYMFTAHYGFTNNYKEAFINMQDV